MSQAMYDLLTYDTLTLFLAAFWAQLASVADGRLPSVVRNSSLCPKRFGAGFEGGQRLRLVEERAGHVARQRQLYHLQPASQAPKEYSG